MTQVISAQQSAPAPFRVTTNAVVVDVTVRQGEASVSDLTAAEFRVLDDGVPQNVQFADTRKVPLDFWILTDTGVETSGSRARAKFPVHIRAVAGLLRPGDRLAVLSTANPLHAIVPLTPVPVTEIPAMALKGVPNVLDGIADALLIPGVPGRRHLVVAQTTGEDLVSVTNPERLGLLITRSDAVLDVAFTDSPRLRDSLRAAARASGGTTFDAKDIEDAVRQVLSSLEHGYVLTYVATGVPRGGWHTISVAVTRAGTFTIGARHGYFSD